MVQQMPYIGKAPKGKIPCMHLTLLKHQNTKTSLYKLSKNHWVITLLENFGSVRRKLQSTVFLDHPVVMMMMLNMDDSDDDKVAEYE